MKNRFLLLCCALVCGQALAQQPSPAAPDRSTAPREAASPAAYPARADRTAAMPDPDKLMAAEPTSAGPLARPLTRQQVVAEIERARRAGEMDFAAFEASLPSSTRR
jgi:hypothetical protein